MTMIICIIFFFFLHGTKYSFLRNILYRKGSKQYIYFFLIVSTMVRHLSSFLVYRNEISICTYIYIKDGMAGRFLKLSAIHLQIKFHKNSPIHLMLI